MFAFDIICKELSKESSYDDGGNVRCAVHWDANQINELSVGGDENHKHVILL